VCKHTFVKEERRSSDGLLLPPKFSRSPSSTSGDRKRRRHTSRPCDEQYSCTVLLLNPKQPTGLISLDPSPPNSTSTRHPHGNQWHQSTVDQSLGGIDPFDTLQFSQYGISQDRMTDMALHHCIPSIQIHEPQALTSAGTNVFQKTRMPLTPRPLWLRICLSDPVLLSVTYNLCPSQKSKGKSVLLKASIASVQPHHTFTISEECACQLQRISSRKYALYVLSTRQ